MLRKGIGSAGEPCSSASDLLNTRTRYDQASSQAAAADAVAQKAKARLRSGYASV